MAELNKGTIVLDEKKLSALAESLFDGAIPAQKKSDPVAVLRNTSDENIIFNVVLKDGTVENRDASIPPNGMAVVQVGGEINVMADFSELYEDVQSGVNTELSAHTDKAISRAGIKANGLERFTAMPKQRVDQYIKLPFDANGNAIDFAIMKPWGEGGALIPQEAKSGDVLVLNGANNSLYFNSVNGTLGNFIHAETGEPIPDLLGEMKTAPIDELHKGIKTAARQPVVKKPGLPKGM